MSGWGLKFFDYDNDGNLDLFLANGHPDDLIESLHSDVNYQEPPVAVSQHGKWFRERQRSRAGRFLRNRFQRAAWPLGDFDNDGAVDVLIRVNDAAPVLLRNNAGSKNHWLGVRLVGTKSNPRRDRSAHHLPGGRSEAKSHESRRRQLSVFARSPDGAGPWKANQN